MQRKAQRPKNINYKKLPFPLWVQPKIDGVRGINMDGAMTARTLKKHRNKFVTAQFSTQEHIGFDGEFAAGAETAWDLCRKTGSAMSTEHGSPFVLWHVFDFINENTVNLPYKFRYQHMKETLLGRQAQGLCGHLRLVPYVIVTNAEELQTAHQRYLDMGYEGSVVYNPEGFHKEGNCSPINGPVWRIKDFVDFEAEIIGYTEGDKNENEAQKNELGHTFRTSHQENKVPNGMIGNLLCRALDDVHDLQDETRVLIKKGDEFTAAPGFMDHATRLTWFQNPSLFMNQIAKLKMFPKGMKDKPRFPQFISLRSKEDL